MAEHELKILPAFFAAVQDGTKTFEVRRDDRGFAVGDVLHLRERHPMAGYTGRELRRVVTFMLAGGQYGIEAGYCVLGLLDAEVTEGALG